MNAIPRGRVVEELKSPLESWQAIPKYSVAKGAGLYWKSHLENVSISAFEGSWAKRLTNLV